MAYINQAVLSSYANELSREDNTFIPHVFQIYPRVSEMKLFGFTEIPVFLHPSTSVTHKNTIVYSFILPKDFSISHTFSLYIKNYPDFLLGFQHLRIKCKDIIYEDISREFLACWIRLFKQPSFTHTGEYLLPIFLNRYSLSYYTDWLPELTFEFAFSQVEYSPEINLCYRGQQLFAKDKREITPFFTKDIYYFYDSIQTYNTWIKMEYPDTYIYLSGLNEPFHRISDLFIVVIRENTLIKPSDIIESVSFYIESAEYMTISEKHTLSPVHKWKYTYIPNALESRFAPEISEIWYLPFSTIHTLYMEYTPRPYFNTRGVANFSLKLNIHKDVNVSDYKMCLRYISPTYIKAN